MFASLWDTLDTHVTLYGFVMHGMWPAAARTSAADNTYKTTERTSADKMKVASNHLFVTLWLFAWYCILCFTHTSFSFIHGMASEKQFASACVKQPAMTSLKSHSKEWKDEGIGTNNRLSVRCGYCLKHINHLNKEWYGRNSIQEYEAM